MMPAHVPCRFYQQGRCRNGECCAFSHDMHPLRDTEIEACKFFARGYCAAGDTCHFAHPAVDGCTTSTPAVEYDSHWYSDEEAYIEDEEEAEEEEEFDATLWEEWAGEDGSGTADWEKRPVCQRYVACGRCAAWHTCEAIHGLYCETCQRFCLHPYDGKQRLQHVRDCAERADREASHAASAEQDCGICLERVMDKAAFSERRFGLLDCEHVFCLGCVRSWRCQVDGGVDVDTALRTCPVCRQVTWCVTPSSVWPRTAAEKAAIIGKYKAKLATIDCRHYNDGKGVCPFGTSCHYRHPGAKEAPPPRKYLSADGEVKFNQPVRLSDFLEGLRL